MTGMAERTTPVLVRRAVTGVLLVLGLVYARSVDVEASVAHVHFAVVLAMSVSALFLLWTRAPDPFSPLSYTSFYLLYGFFGILASFVVRGEDALPRLPGSTGERAALAVDSVLLNVVFFATYGVVYLLAERRRIRREAREAARLDLPPPPLPRWSRPRLLIVTAACLLVFALTYGEFQRRLGFPLFDASTLRAGKAVWRSDPSLSWMIRGTQFIFVPVLLWGGAAFASGHRGRMLGVLAGAVVAAFLISRMGQRGTAVYPLIALVGIYHYGYRRVPWSALALATFLLVVYVNATTRVRTLGVSMTDAVADTSGWPLDAFSEHEAERSRLDSTAIVLFYFPERREYLLGESWLPLTVALVPRWLVPDKSKMFPNSDTGLLSTLVGLPAPVPLPALMFANFGPLGVPIGGALMGLFHQALYASTMRRRGDPGRTILYLLMLVFVSPTPLGFSSFLQYVFPCWVALKFLERDAPRDAEDERALTPPPGSGITRSPRAARPHAP